MRFTKIEMDIINNAINSLNSSTFFAGIMMICLNIGSRYIQLNLDESTESYIKYALTKEILVFTISWMATRNIYSALVLTAVFVVLADFVLNEKSSYCLLPKNFIKSRKLGEYTNNKVITEKEFNDAMDIVEKYKTQKSKSSQLNYLDAYNMNKM
jgi:hypothetical protein